MRPEFDHIEAVAEVGGMASLQKNNLWTLHNDIFDAKRDIITVTVDS